jgi:hypothetical protein
MSDFTYLLALNGKFYQKGKGFVGTSPERATVLSEQEKNELCQAYFIHRTNLRPIVVSDLKDPLVRRLTLSNLADDRRRS